MTVHQLPSSNRLLTRFPEPKSPDQLWQLGLQAIQQNDMATALRLFSQVAADGDWAAHYMLGYLYLCPFDGSEPDVETSLRHMELSAQTGNSNATLGLGIALIATGADIERRRAFSVLSTCAELGDPAAKILCGLLAIEGRVADKQAELAEQLWLDAASQNWVWAMQLLADLYLSRGQFWHFLKWKWQVFATTVELAKRDKEDIRLTNAT